MNARTWVSVVVASLWLMLTPATGWVQEGALPPPQTPVEAPGSESEDSPPTAPLEAPSPPTIPLGATLEEILGPLPSLNCRVSSPGGVITILQCEESSPE